VDLLRQVMQKHLRNTYAQILEKKNEPKKRRKTNAVQPDGNTQQHRTQRKKVETPPQETTNTGTNHKKPCIQREKQKKMKSSRPSGVNFQ